VYKAIPMGGGGGVLGSESVSLAGHSRTPFNLYPLSIETSWSPRATTTWIFLFPRRLLVEKMLKHPGMCPLLLKDRLAVHSLPNNVCVCVVDAFVCLCVFSYDCRRVRQCLSTPGPSPTSPMATPRSWRTSWLSSWLDATALWVCWKTMFWVGFLKRGNVHTDTSNAIEEDELVPRVWLSRTHNDSLKHLRSNSQ